jgi:hypothetical protein
MARTALAALVASLFAFGAPASAQQAPIPELRGVTAMRYALGIISTPQMRQACSITEALERQLYGRMRDVIVRTGVDVPSDVQVVEETPGQRVLVGIPATAGHPLILVSASIVAAQVGPQVACGYAIIVKVDQQVTGGRSTPNNAQVNREITVWLYDDAYVGGAGDFVRALGDGLDDAGKALDAALRASIR